MKFKHAKSITAVLLFLGSAQSLSALAESLPTTYNSLPASTLTNKPPRVYDQMHNWVGHAPWWLHPVVGLSVGAATAEVGRSQTVSPTSTDIYTYQYTRNGAHSSQIMWGGFLGTEIKISPLWAIQVGLGYYQPSSFTANGMLTQGVDAKSSDQYGYTYQVLSRQLLAEAKVLLSVQERFHPYVSLGLGAAFNRAYAYTATIPAFTAFTRQYTSHSNATFSYGVGAGLDVDMQNDWRLGLGYRFASLGHADLGSGYIDTTAFSGKLSQSNLYAQEVDAHIAFLLF